MRSCSDSSPSGISSLLSACAQARLCGGRAAAREQAQAALHLAREAGDAAAVANALCELALNAEAASDLPLASELAEGAARAARECGDESVLAWAEGQRGFITLRQGRMHEAEVVLREALRRADACGDARAVAHAAGTLGEACRMQGKLEEARELLLRACEAADQLGEADRTCMCLVALGHVQVERQELQMARETRQRAEEFHGVASPVVRVLLLRLAARIEAVMDHMAAAISRLEEARQIAAESGHESLLTSILLELAGIHHEEGNVQAAIEACEACCEAVSTRDNALTIPRAANLQVRCHLGNKEPARARAVAEAALSRTRALGDLEAQGAAGCLLGCVHMDCGDRLAAYQAWMSTLALLGDHDGQSAEDIRRLISEGTGEGHGAGSQRR